MNKELFDYLTNGKTLNDFLDDFPEVSREEAIAVLSQILDDNNGRRAVPSQGRYSGLGAELAG